MQTAVPEVMDITREPQRVIEDYGAQPGAASFANNCLLARRLVERGVRFVQLHDWGWDFHGTGAGEDIRDGLTRKCATMDKPVAALIKDLKQRGLLENTIVVWAGEFGRTPMCEIRDPRDVNNAGRDHHPLAYSLFLAGGGIKAGTVVGKTDDLCMNVVEDRVHVHDLQATLLHCLGLDHTRLTYHHLGRDFRLTDVAGNVVQKMLA
jgi:uncharacterized protein (DUF1501 family)